jgi:hypothetical protein
MSGQLCLTYGSSPGDATLFALTLNPQYVALATGKTPPVTFNEIEKYAYDHAGALRAMRRRKKPAVA